MIHWYYQSSLNSKLCQLYCHHETDGVFCSACFYVTRGCYLTFAQANEGALLLGCTNGRWANLVKGQHRWKLWLNVGNGHHTCLTYSTLLTTKGAAHVVETFQYWGIVQGILCRRGMASPFHVMAQALVACMRATSLFNCPIVQNSPP